MSNNLNELNSVLFDTLRQVKNKEIDSKQAQAIIGVGNAIINSAKLQLNAAKYVKGAAIESDFFGEIKTEIPRELPVLKEKKKVDFSAPKELYDSKLEYALSLGYPNLSEAISKEGKMEFERKFKESL